MLTNAMEKAIRNNRTSRPGQAGTLIGVRVQPDSSAQLDAWIAEQPGPKLSRPEAMRRLVRSRRHASLVHPVATAAPEVSVILPPLAAYDRLIAMQAAEVTA